MTPPSISRSFELVLCEVFHPLIYGLTPNSSLDISEHYMIQEKIDPSELFVNLSHILPDDIDNLFAYLKMRREMFRKFIQHPSFHDHPSIRNYWEISNEITCSPQIAQCIELPGDECVAILKTHWLRLIQKTWKKIFQQRLNVTKQRKNPRNICYREITGKWQSKCNHMPSIKGMLSSLSNKKDLSLG